MGKTMQQVVVETIVKGFDNQCLVEDEGVEVRIFIESIPEPILITADDVIFPKTWSADLATVIALDVAAAIHMFNEGK